MKPYRRTTLDLVLGILLVVAFGGSVPAMLVGLGFIESTWNFRWVLPVFYLLMIATGASMVAGRRLAVALACLLQFGFGTTCLWLEDGTLGALIGYTLAVLLLTRVAGLFQGDR